MKQKFNNIKIITILLCALMLFPGTLVYAESDNDEGYKDGYNSGWTDGIETAWDDLDENNSKRYSRSLPDNDEIEEYYELDEETKAYKTGFLLGYKNGYKEGYNFGYDNPASGSKAEVNFAEVLGYGIGESNGRIDYFRGKANKWGNSLPATATLITIFGLKNESEAYKNDFVTEFKTNFRSGYEYGYRNAKYEPIMTAVEQGETDGKELGEAFGKNSGKTDYYRGNANQWKRDLPDDAEINNMFFLNKDSKEYMEAFLGAFKAAYELKYNEAYREAKVEYSILSISEETVPISGAELFSGDNKVKLGIESGIFYGDIIASINILDLNNSSIKLPGAGILIKASELYTVRVENTGNYINRDKPVILRFEHYGNENSGIYKHTEAGWIYIPGKIDATGITASINPESINNKSVTYGVFIDKNAKNPYDLRGHWAKDEVVAFLRRGIVGVYGDESFRPDIALNHGQAIYWINSIYKTKLEATKALVSPVTYKEFEELIIKASKDKTFTWNYMAEKIIENKDKRSGSYNSMNNYITKAEAIYALYYMNE